ncbi:MAG: hypothetical protein MK142_00165, partial [Pseudomonadales bacterium]|nr:hypothetical protein [Pseudomonadales bacterium]
MSTAVSLDDGAAELAAFDDALSHAEARLQDALAYVRGAVAERREAGSGDADDFQLQIYDLAFLRAHLSAAAAILRWAHSQAPGHAQAMAGLFVAEAVSELRTRIGMRAGDFGLTREAI